MFKYAFFLTGNATTEFEITNDKPCNDWNFLKLVKKKILPPRKF
ncbi:MAG: hypothetical protein CM15mV143_250 [Caudoviricetes sp.]|nr:MAG: hypothetical protein CM15mV143_250 [Caudoviricetes sp.]